MKKLLFVLMLSTISLFASAQVVTLRFSGESSSQEALRLDSVDVMNTTRSWSEKLIYPDSVLILTTSGIEDCQAKGVSLECYPNPFNGTAMVGLHLDNNEKVMLQLFNLAGQKVAEYSQSLSAGLHAFEVSVAAPQIYLLSAITSQGRTTIKMISHSAAGCNQITSQGLMKLGIAKKTSAKPFYEGDRMRYVGYTTYKGKVFKSTPLSQSQRESENIKLVFGLDKMTVTTNSVKNVTNTTAEVSVSVDAGDDIVSRGVCWSLSPEPTITDFHLTQSGGAGTFSCYLSSLTVGTTYYVRGYAINSSGVVYGNELTFTTTNISFICGVDKVTDFDKYSYKTVKIGNQCWMRENLSSGHYSDGVLIDMGNTAGDRPFRYYPGDNDMNLPAYGYLYNWSAVMRDAVSSDGNSRVQGVCPNGWHVPSNAELQQMLDYVKSVPEYWCNGDSNNIMKVLADKILWAPNDAMFEIDTCAVGHNLATNNATGLSLRPAGLFYSTHCRNMETHGYIWTSTAGETKGNACYLYVSNQSSTAEIYENSSQMGLSVRCVYNESVANDSSSFVCEKTMTKDFDGNEYGSIRVGNQCWMKENVRSEHYLDGTPIAKGTEMMEDTTYRYFPDNDSSKVATFGYLYNWKAAMNGAKATEANPSGVQGVCPEGWHVPSDAEWSMMMNYLGKQSKFTCDNDASNIAKALAATTGWKESANEEQKCNVGYDLASNNVSGFTALPAGAYAKNAATGFGEKSCFWSATANGNYVNFNELNYNASYVTHDYDKKEVGYSVRCVR